MEYAKILIYGAGPLGSFYAARLTQAGHDVALLARGQRLADLREHGVVLRNFETGEQSVTPVNLVERLSPEDAYDLVLVIMRKNRACDILPILAANKHTPNVVFLMNNAAGPDEFVRALGKDRVLVGFPMAGGSFEGHTVVYLSGNADKPMTIPIGEVDGRLTERAQRVARILESMAGHKVEIRTDMDAWLKSHVALLMPGMAAALYAVGTDLERLARTRDGLILAIRATREAFRVLRALHVPIVPPKIRMFGWMPEPVLVRLLRKLLCDPNMQIALLGHAKAGHDEITHLRDEFLVLVRGTSVPTPAIDELRRYLDPAYPRIPDGSAAIRMRLL